MCTRNYCKLRLSVVNTIVLTLLTNFAKLKSKRNAIPAGSRDSDSDSDTVLLAEQIVEYNRPQLFAVWKKLNPDGYESISRKALQRYFIERLCESCEHGCTPVPFAVSSKAPSTASDQQEDTPPSTSTPPIDLPQRLSYSKAAQRTPDDMDRKQRECDERLIKTREDKQSLRSQV